MTRKLKLFALLFFLLSGSAYAAIESSDAGSLLLPEPALDMVVSADGKRLFILLNEGRVEVYSSGGKREGELQLEKGVDKIEVAPEGDRLFATSGKSKKISIAAIDYIQSFNVSDSAYIGNPQAEIIVASFNDFQ